MEIVLTALLANPQPLLSASHQWQGAHHLLRLLAPFLRCLERVSVWWPEICLSDLFHLLCHLENQKPRKLLTCLHVFEGMSLLLYPSQTSSEDPTIIYMDSFQPLSDLLIPSDWDTKGQAFLKATLSNTEASLYDAVEAERAQRDYHFPWQKCAKTWDVKAMGLSFFFFAAFKRTKQQSRKPCSVTVVRYFCFPVAIASGHNYAIQVNIVSIWEKTWITALFLLGYIIVLPLWSDSGSKEQEPGGTLCL